MKHISLLILSLFIGVHWSAAQNLPEDQAAWVVEMLSANPNLNKVDSLYRDWFKENKFQKSYYTQYYKRWYLRMRNFADAQGNIRIPSTAEWMERNRRIQDMNASSGSRSTNWTHVGPDRVFNTAGELSNNHANVYSIDQNLSQPNVLYSGTENGEIYKSIDTGHSWSCVSLDYNCNGGVYAVCSDPSNPNIVFAGSWWSIMRSADGGGSWTYPLTLWNLVVNEFLIHPSNSNLVWAACDDGLYKSTDAGLSFTRIVSGRCYDLKMRPGTENVFYLLKNSSDNTLFEFWLSTDTTNTFTNISSGWYTSSDPARSTYGGRIGVSVADPLRVYCYLNGDSAAGDVGGIGIWRSNDGGLNWSHPAGGVGAPYTGDHPNITCGWPGWDYHQGNYNCAIMVSSTDADEILIGSLNLWRSRDGGATYDSVSGYVGGNLSMHVDNQDFRHNAFGSWITTDGGIYFSNDFFNSNEQERNNGVRSTAYWGFGQGWNEDIFGAGAYHNGNTIHTSGYADNELLSLGGGEAATGYVNPSTNHHTYFSDLGGVVVPESFTSLNYFPVGMWPNESYWANYSSDMVFNPESYNTIYLGRENKLWKSTNGGKSFKLLKQFGTDVDAWVNNIEIAYDDNKTIYVSQRPTSGPTGFLWKSTDGGLNFAPIVLPSAGTGSRDAICISVDKANPNILMLAYPNGGNGNKVYKSTDGALTFSNMSSPLLDDQAIRDIDLQSLTDGDVYLFSNTSIYYRNNSLSDWQVEHSGLPAFIDPNKAMLFYRDQKIRFASWDKSIWEKELNQSSGILAQAMSDKIDFYMGCGKTLSDTFRFECHSILVHEGAQWEWSFPGGTPSTASGLHADVVYNSVGTKLAVLTITDSSGRTDTDSMYVHVYPYEPATILSEGFETDFPPLSWDLIDQDGLGCWNQANFNGGYAASLQSAFFDNYYYYNPGTHDDVAAYVDLTDADEAFISFDVAYAQYADPGYVDSLLVLASLDCGANFEPLYAKTGAGLETAAPTYDWFNPASDQWRTDTVSLNDYLNADNLMISFRNVNGYGNVLYLDNINLHVKFDTVVIDTTEDTTALIADLDRKLQLYPNPATTQNVIHLSGLETQTALIVLYNAKGEALLRQRIRNGLFYPPADLLPGTYQMLIETDEYLLSRRLLIVE